MKYLGILAAYGAAMGLFRLEDGLSFLELLILTLAPVALEQYMALRIARIKATAMALHGDFEDEE